MGKTNRQNTVKSGYGSKRDTIDAYGEKSFRHWIQHMIEPLSLFDVLFIIVFVLIFYFFFNISLF